MNKQIVLLAGILAGLFLAISVMSWTNANVVSEGVVFSKVSPLIMGLFIVGIVAVLILIIEFGRKQKVY